MVLLPAVLVLNSFVTFKEILVNMYHPWPHLV